MKIKEIPFNISLLTPTDQDVKFLRPVKVMEIYDNTGVNFHDDGFYSTSIFGRVGSKERDKIFAYIDLKMPIFHPEVFENLKKLKELYAGIMSGTAYATWDDVTKDFVASNPMLGKTGYDFFMEHWPKIQYKETPSDLRKLRIKFLEKYKNESLMSKHLVMPAGLRDIEVENGQTREDDINGLYKRLLSASNTITSVTGDHDYSVYNVPRWVMQRTAGEIYEMIMSTLKGKGGWIQRVFASRKTINGTRNVITAMDTSVPFMDSPDSIEPSDSLIGLVQVLRGALPFTINGLNNSILQETFGGDDLSVWLVNRKTLERELVEVSIETIDRYGTRTGREKLINRFFVPESRNRPLVIEGYYLGLIYVDDKYFRVFKDINELPEHLSRKNVYPLTLADLLYTSTIDNYRNLSGTITRYPVTGTGSTYPTKFKVRTTTKTFTKTRLDSMWEPIPDSTVYNFPDRSKDARWMSSLSVHSIRLAGLGGDKKALKVA